MKQTHRPGLTHQLVRLGPALPSPRDKHGFLIRPGLTMKVKEQTWEAAMELRRSSWQPLATR